MGDPRDDETICAAWDEWNRNTPEKFWDVAVWIKEGKGDRDVRFGSLDAGNRFEIWAHGYAAARAVVEAADTEDEPPLCTCDHPEAAHICHFDHNECFICGCREFRTNEAAHMAAPDELTALRAEAERWKNDSRDQFGLREQAEAERDALRKRIRALADEWEDLDHKDHCWDCDRGSDLRKLLGDA